MKFAIFAAIVGELLIAAGLYLIFPPAALIVVGVQIFTVALLSGGSK